MAAPALVSQQQGATAVASTTQVFTVPAGGYAAGQGLTILAMVGTTTATSTVSDSKGNTWQSVVGSPWQGSATISMHALWCKVSVPLVAGDTITFTSNTSTHLAAVLGEWSSDFGSIGTATPTPVGYVSATNATVLDPPAVTTGTGHAAIVVAANVSSAVVGTPPTGYTLQTPATAVSASRSINWATKSPAATPSEDPDSAMRMGGGTSTVVMVTTLDVIPSVPAVRVFNGSSDGISFNPGATLGMDGGPYTLALLFKRNSTNVGGLLMNAANATASTSSFAQNFAMWIEASATNNIYATTQAGSSVPALPVVNADGWVLAVATKANGTAAPRFHRYNLSTATIARANGASTLADGSAITSTHRWTLGKDEFLNKVAMKLAVAGVWDVALTDAQVDELYAHLSSQDWMSNSAGTPKALWEFNQWGRTVPVADITGGGATQFDIAGTSVDLADPPPGWTFGATVPSAGTGYGDNSYGFGSYGTRAAGGSVITSATVSFDAQSNVTGTGVVAVRAPSATLDGQSTLAGAGVTAVRAPTATLDGQSTFAGAGRTSQRAPSASLDGQSTFVGAGVASVRAPTTTLDGQSTFAGAGRTSLKAPSASLDGQSTFAGSGISALRAAAATLDAQSVFTGVGGVRIIGLAGTMSGDSTFVGAGRTSLKAPSASLDGQSIFTGAGGAAIRAASVTLDAQSSLTGVGGVRIFGLAATMAGDSTFTGAGRTSLKAPSASLDGQSTFAGAGSLLFRAIAASLDAQSTFTGAGRTLLLAPAASLDGQSIFNGSGVVKIAAPAIGLFGGGGDWLIITGSQVVAASVTFSGLGDFTATPGKLSLRAPSTTLDGQSTFAGAGRSSLKAPTASLDGQSTFAGAGRTSLKAPLASLDGQSTFAGAGRSSLKAPSATLDGQSTFAGAGRILFVASPATLSGLSTLTGAGGLRFVASPASFDAASSLTGVGLLVIRSVPMVLSGNSDLIAIFVAEYKHLTSPLNGVVIDAGGNGIVFESAASGVVEYSSSGTVVFADISGQVVEIVTNGEIVPYSSSGVVIEVEDNGTIR